MAITNKKQTKIKESSGSKQSPTKTANAKAATVDTAIKNIKRRVIVNYNQLSPELVELLNEKYPLGWRNFIIKVEKGNGDFFHAIMLDTDDVSYLIKVEVKIDSEFSDEVEKDLLGTMPDEDEFMGEEEQEEEYDEAEDN